MICNGQITWCIQMKYSYDGHIVREWDRVKNDGLIRKQTSNEVGNSRTTGKEAENGLCLAFSHGLPRLELIGKAWDGEMMCEQEKIDSTMFGQVCRGRWWNVGQEWVHNLLSAHCISVLSLCAWGQCKRHKIQKQMESHQACKHDFFFNWGNWFFFQSNHSG